MHEKTYYKAAVEYCTVDKSGNKWDIEIITTKKTKPLKQNISISRRGFPTELSDNENEDQYQDWIEK